MRTIILLLILLIYAHCDKYTGKFIFKGATIKKGYEEMSVLIPDVGQISTLSRYEGELKEVYDKNNYGINCKSADIEEHSCDSNLSKTMNEGTIYYGFGLNKNKNVCLLVYINDPFSILFSTDACNVTKNIYSCDSETGIYKFEDLDYSSAFGPKFSLILLLIFAFIAFL